MSGFDEIRETVKRVKASADDTPMAVTNAFRGAVDVSIAPGSPHHGEAYQKFVSYVLPRVGDSISGPDGMPGNWTVERVIWEFRDGAQRPHVTVLTADPRR